MAPRARLGLGLGGVALVLLALVARGEEPGRWEPARTHVFAASVVRWKDKGLAPFERPRLDDTLVAAIGSAGVPRENVVFLKDEAATRAAILTELGAVARRAGKGSTLVFYFQGHGLRDAEGTTLACYDVDTREPVKTGIPVAEVSAILEKDFAGERAIFFGDCCHSGALSQPAAALGKRGVRAAVLASATASNRSTSFWTFTEALVSIFAGEGVCDRDRDGWVTFAEADTFVHEEMKYAEGQLARGERFGGFEGSFVLRAARPLRQAAQGPWKVGDYVEARDREGKWYGARVIDVREGGWKVHYPGWEDHWDDWVPAERIRKLERKPLRIGERYEVEWEPGQWYVGVVLEETEGFFYYVHYSGEAGDDDEWITSRRARPLRDGAWRPEFAALGQAPAKGDRVVARWRKQWWLATVTAVEGPLFRVHYADDTRGTVLGDEIFKTGGAKAGERVLAEWDGGRAYAGKVVSVADGRARVAWDDGSKPSDVPVERVAPVKALR